MNAGLGMGGFLVLAIVWFLLKPILVGLLQGIRGLFSGKKKE